VPQKLPTLPDLAWIHCTGPLELDVVASIVQVYVSSDPPAAALGSG
jgi:hypothetical protein